MVAFHNLIQVNLKFNLKIPIIVTNMRIKVRLADQLTVNSSFFLDNMINNFDNSEHFSIDGSNSQYQVRSALTVLYCPDQP